MNEYNNEWWRLVLPNQRIGQIHVQSALPSILCYCYSILLILIYSTPRSCFPLPLFIQVVLALIINFARIQLLPWTYSPEGCFHVKLTWGAHLYYILGGKTRCCSTSSLGAFTMETGRGRKYLFLPLPCRKRMQLILFKKENEFRPPCGRVCLPVVWLW